MNLNTFFEKIYNTVRYYNLESISKIFTENHSNSINKSDFIEGLKKLDYLPNSDEFNSIITRYSNKYNPDQILLIALEEDFNNWYENKQSEDSKRQQKEEFDRKRQEIINQMKNEVPLVEDNIVSNSGGVDNKYNNSNQFGGSSNNNSNSNNNNQVNPNFKTAEQPFSFRSEEEMRNYMLNHSTNPQNLNSGTSNYVGNNSASNNFSNQHMNTNNYNSYEGIQQGNNNINNINNTMTSNNHQMHSQDKQGNQMLVNNNSNSNQYMQSQNYNNTNISNQNQMSNNNQINNSSINTNFPINNISVNSQNNSNNNNNSKSINKQSNLVSMYNEPNTQNPPSTNNNFNNNNFNNSVNTNFSNNHQMNHYQSTQNPNTFEHNINKPNFENNSKINYNANTNNTNNNMNNMNNTNTNLNNMNNMNNNMSHPMNQSTGFNNTQSFIRDVSSNPNPEKYQNKFSDIENKLLRELRNNERYLLSEMYKELNAKYVHSAKEFHATFTGFDPKNTGFISAVNLDSFFDETGFIFSDEEKRLISNDLSRNSNGDYYYFDLIAKIEKFNPRDLHLQVRNYHLFYNDYIIALRKHINEGKKDLANIWKEVFGNKSEIKYTEFVALMLRLGFTSLTEEEYHYLFTKLSEDNVIIKFQDFKNTIKLQPPEQNKQSFKTSNFSSLKQEQPLSDGASINSNPFSKNSNQNANSSVINNNNQQLQNSNNNINTNNNITSNNSINTSKHLLKIRDPMFLSTLSQKNENEKRNIIMNRISSVEEKVTTEIRKNTQYKVYEGLEILFNNLVFKGVNKQVLFNYFFSKDIRKTDKKMSEVEICMVLGELGFPDLTREKVVSILQTLKNKTPMTFSYEELIEKIFSYQQQNRLDIITKYHACLNDYIIDFRDYISEKKADVAMLWKKLFNDMQMMNLQQFIQFCNYCQYDLAHNDEYAYLFSKLSADGVNIIQISLINSLLEEPKSLEALQEETDFRQTSNWKKNIANYDEQNSSVHKQHFQKIFNILKLIHDKSIAEGFKDLTKLFDDIEVTPNGECAEIDFINRISKIKVNVRDNSFIYLLSSFKGKSGNQVFSLINFMNAYYAFFWKERQSKPEGKKEDDKSVHPNSINDNQGNQNNTTAPNNNQQFPDITLKTAEFSEDEISYFAEMINFTADIILDEKCLDLKVYFEKMLQSTLKKKADSTGKEQSKESTTTKNNNITGFTEEEFKDILETDLLVETDDSTRPFYRFLKVDSIDNKKLTSVITIDRIMQVYQRFSKKGVMYKAPSKPPSTNQPIPNNNNTNTLQNQFQSNNSPNKQTNQDILLKPEELLLSDFAKHLKLNRIKWLSVFPHLAVSSNNLITTNNNSTNQISLSDFQACFNLAKFNITSKEVNSLINYLDPNHQQYIPVDVLRNNIKRFQKDYFDLPFQNQDQQLNQPSLLQGHENTGSFNNNSNTNPMNTNNTNTNNNNNNNNSKPGMMSTSIINTNNRYLNTNVNSILNSNPMLIEILKKMNLFIEKNNFTVEDFFNYFNKNGDNSIDLTELIKMIKQIDKTVEIKKISELFELIDKDQSGYIQLNELRVFLKSADLKHEDIVRKTELGDRMTKEINELFDKFDLDKDNKISENDFYLALKSMNPNTTWEDVKVIMKKVDRDGNHIVDRNEFSDVLGGKLKEQLAFEVEEKEYMIRLFQEEDIEKLGYLTVKQMKDLLINKLKCEFDPNGPEIAEIINAVDTNFDGVIDINEFVKLLEDNINTQNPNINHTVRQIHLSRRLNPQTFLSIFKGLPMNFIPSFLREEMKLLRVLPGSTMIPTTDITGILFNDITVSNLTIKSGLGNYVLGEILPVVCCKITFDYATGVPIPDESLLDRYKEIGGRVLRICFFNKRQRKFFGNCVNIECIWKKEYEDRWYFEEDRKKFNHNILVRYSPQDSTVINPEEVFLVFEFVLFVRKDNEITEVSCGWSQIDLLSLKTSEDFKLTIRGGTPLKVNLIEDSDIRFNRSGFAKIFSGNKPTSTLPIKVKDFKDLSKQDKLEANFLPTTLIIQKTALSIASTYRKYIGKLIINNPAFNSKKFSYSIPIIKSFSEITNSHDAFKTTVELWNQFIVEQASSTDKNNPTYFEKHLIDVINRISTLLYSDKFGYSELDPSKMALGNQDLVRIRFNLVSNIIRIEKDKKSKIEGLTPIESMTSFKPFSIRECKQQKVSIIKNIDEVYSSKKLLTYYNNIGGEVKSVITNSKFLD